MEQATRKQAAVLLRHLRAGRDAVKKAQLTSVPQNVGWMPRHRAVLAALWFTGQREAYDIRRMGALRYCQYNNPVGVGLQRHTTTFMTQVKAVPAQPRDEQREAAREETPTLPATMALQRAG